MEKNFSQLQKFPSNERNFRKIFYSENHCIAYLFKVRWPDGFICPACRWQQQLPACRTLICPHCGNHTSLTSDTVMHGTKKPLCQWLLAIWWLCLHDSGASAKELQRLLHLSSYQTAWTWMQKLRMVMAMADVAPCHGIVEIGCSKVAPAWEKADRSLVIAAAETILPSGITGRIRMWQVDELKSTTVEAFIRSAITPGSAIVASGLPPYAEAAKYGSTYVVDSPKKNPVRILEIISSFEIWLNKVHRGGVGIKHLQHYLDEFCFRNNSTILPDRMAVFTSLLKGCMAGKTIPYRELIREQTLKRGKAAL